MKRRHLLAFVAIHVACYSLFFTPRLREDAPYYYEPLRSAFFDRDVNFYNERPYTRPVPKRGRKQRFVAGPNERQRPMIGGPNNTFDIGTTMLEAPFFLAGHAVSRLAQAAGRPVAAHGYSAAYVLPMSIGFLAAALGGTILLYQLSRELTGDSNALWATVLGVWGSFMPAYFYEDTLLSHLPSFVASCLFLWLLARSRREPRASTLFALGAAFAWLVMTRRQNLLLGVLFLVVLPSVGRGLVPRRGGGPQGPALRGVLALAAGFLVVLLPELWLWRIEYGSFLSNPGMVPFRSRPLLALTLLSDHGGLFSQSPILLVAALGAPWLLAKDRLLGAALLLGALSQILINALRVEWWSGLGWGNRRFDSIVPIFTLFLAALLDRAPRGSRRAVIAIGILLLAWNLAALPQFYAGDTVNDNGSLFNSFAMNRNPKGARLRWPFPPIAKIPALLREDVAIVARQSFTLRPSLRGASALAAVALSSLAVAGLFRVRLSPRVARLALLGLPVLFSLPLLTGFLAVAMQGRDVIAVYYDPPEPIERLTVGPGPFRGGVAPLTFVPGQERTFVLDPEARASFVEVVLEAPLGPTCIHLEGLPPIQVSPQDGTPLSFPNAGRHLRLELGGDVTYRLFAVRNCGRAPFLLYGLALGLDRR